MPIYLDNSATTRPSEAVVAAMAKCMREGYFNPSALYAPALQSAKMLREGREALLAAVHASAGSRVVFTSGGTEADNLAVLGSLSAQRGGDILYSAGEHPAVREACLSVKGLNAKVIPYTRAGLVDLDALEGLLSPETRLICCMQVNNETGAIQPLARIARLRDRLAPDALLHVDGVQGFLRVPVDMSALKIDSYALSGHKLHAPKGIGALIAGPRVRLRAQLLGGGQEGALRSGTENTPGIAGLIAAVRDYPRDADIRSVKMRLWALLQAIVPGAVVNGPAPDSDDAAPHILNVSLPPVRSETMLHALEAKEIYVGMGSACSSHKQKISPVLESMHVPRSVAESALRFSLCPENTQEEMERTAQAVGQCYALLAKYQRR
ncbi:MAG: cysteine desulfurase [Clostridiales bacterium]|nr:cysteine desulfurase [Clostridiales bacterium]